MHRVALLTVAAALASALAAQSNTVPGLNGRLTVVDDLTYYGRRGPAHPGGEIGMAMLNEMCNPGSVQIPWQAAMQPNHPKFGFLIMRESGGRFVQISDRSYCKHAFTSTNYSGPCGSCIDPGTGSVMGLNCADTYGSGNNADRNWLGPADELDPWLGTWNPIGSYFDRGDPPVSGPQANDGVRSLNISGFDSVKNRVTVKEADMLVAGARYFYGIHLMHQGEAAANRGDNLASRGFDPAWNGSTWSFSNNSVGQVYGSILQHWTGASVNGARNGNDDGTFFVAVKTTNLGGGLWRYEYAVHNADNNRGGASLRIPIGASVTASNFSFRDIDANPLNDWTATRVGNEIVFAATATNPLNWNTVYNFGFDCTIAPAVGQVQIDEARIGPGALSVAVDSQIPSGVPGATTALVGTGCGGCDSSYYENFGAGAFDLANSSLTMAFAGGRYTVGAGTGTFVAPSGTTLSLGDDDEASISLPFTLQFPGGSTSTLVVCSNGFVSAGSGNGTSYQPSSSAFLAMPQRCWAPTWHDWNPAAGGSVIVDTTPTAVRVTWLNVPHFGVAGSQNTFQLQFLASGTVHYLWQGITNAGGPHLTGFSRGNNAPDPGQRDISAGLATPFSVCNTGVVALALDASARPVLGTTIQMVTSNIPAGTPLGATLLSFVQAIPPQDLTALGMEGCFAHVVGGVTHTFIAPGASASVPFFAPNVPGIIGLPLAAQSFTFSAGFNTLGVIASNGLVLTLGM
jgi:hypothetical protein